MHLKTIILFLLISILSQPTSLLAFDISNSFTLESTVTTVGQHAELENVFKEDGSKVSDTDRSTVVVDISANFHPTMNDEFQITYSFAEGRAINGVEAFSLAPFADDLEEDLSAINNSDRYNLLEAWYKRSFDISEFTSLDITAGIISSTGYIDDNEYANDEISQFMNEALVNNTLANLPDYDIGAALEFNTGLWSIKAVVMESENDDRNDYNYYAIQFGHHVTTRWGMGNYRIFAFTTDDEFVDREGTGKDRLTGFGISIDQQLNESIGVFARLGLQDDDVSVEDEIISFGLSITGNQWNRADDHLGIGVAFLDGANEASSGIKDTKAFEAYYKYVFSDNFDLTLDAQWIENNLREEKNPKGTLIGLRFNANF